MCVYASVCLPIISVLDEAILCCRRRNVFFLSNMFVIMLFFQTMRYCNVVAELPRPEGPPGTEQVKKEMKKYRTMP